MTTGDRESIADGVPPHGPCCSFSAPGGQRIAVYELARPDVDEHFAGRRDF